MVKRLIWILQNAGWHVCKRRAPFFNRTAAFGEDVWRFQRRLFSVITKSEFIYNGNAKHSSWKLFSLTVMIEKRFHWNHFCLPQKLKIVVENTKQGSCDNQTCFFQEVNKLFSETKHGFSVKYAFSSFLHRINCDENPIFWTRKIVQNHQSSITKPSK